jgi:16S rRNA G966 N2-methylase RsmD
MAKKKLDTGKQLFDSQDAASAKGEASYAGDQQNPNLRQFVEKHATPFNPEMDDYKVAAFNKPITTTKATAIYNMHVYWSKKPHDAIGEYVRHYTKPGDVVLDPFCGSGGTALAALIAGRKAVAIDRSPAATFITKNYCTQVDPNALQQAFLELQCKVEKEISWLYETACDRCGKRATTGYTVYSQVFQCSRCMNSVALFDCVEVTGETAAGKAKTIPVCPRCYPKHVEEINIDSGNRLGSIPVYVAYQCESGCRPKRGERRHNDEDKKKRTFFEKYDLEKIREIELAPIPHWFPTSRMMNAPKGQERWGLLWRPYLSGISEVKDLYTKRNLWALAALRAGIEELADGDIRDALIFGLTGIALNSSKMYQEREGGRSIAKGSYYVPPIGREMVVTNGYYYKVEQQLIPAYRQMQSVEAPTAAISTQSATDLGCIPSNSVDYMFTDPPYSWKVQYGEANFVWESWLGFDTHWLEEEIIVNDVRGKTEQDWADKMRHAMSESYRVLKPGRWLSLCYHDTSEGTWELVQDLMAEVGFVVDKTETALSIDMDQKSWKQVVSDNITKRDLVLNFRKPKPGEWRVAQTFIPANIDVATFAELARHIIQDFLTAHPGATKDRVYDALVSSMVRKGQMEAHDFESLLKSVADEVQQPVKDDLFRNKAPDLWGSHVQSRWYLKETADQVDHAEQAKEDAAAAHLGKFISEYLKKKPELEGVHFSDLFEQYLYVHDKPRRLLADWLVEYFIKTASGTWRLPGTGEGQQLAELREAGTLRRIKRFAKALIESLPLREKDRPGSDVDLLDWLRQCRRAGLYDQGKAIFEKGGLNSVNLTDEQQIEAEDDYRICVRRCNPEEAKPKRQGRKKQDDVESTSGRE